MPILLSAGIVSSGSFTWIDMLTAGIYISASLAFGLLIGGRQKDLKTYLLAGHQMPPALIAVSILAALFSGVSFLGAPAETFNHNLVYLWALIAYFIATPVTTLIFLPFFFRLNFYTAYEYLEHRFDLSLRRLSSAVFVIRACLWLSLALYAPSVVISEMTGVPIWMSVLAAGGATLLYTTIGGMKAVIYTDVIQFCVLLFGIIAILFVAVHKVPGGLVQAWQIAEAGGRTHFFNFSFSPTERMTLWGALIGGVFLNLVSLVTDQVSVQRYLTATSLRESQQALWFKLALTLPVISIFYLTGLALYAYYQVHPEMAKSLSSPDRLLPNFVSHQLASPMPGLLVAAMLSATMSTVSAGINSLTTATLMDFIYCDKAKEGDAQFNRDRVRVARRWTLSYGIIVILLSLFVSRLGTLIEASNKISGFFGGPLLGIFFLGVLSHRANAKGTLIGAISGAIIVISVGCFTSTSFMWYALIGCLSTCAIGEAASRLFSTPNQQQLVFTLRGQRKRSS